MTMARLTKDGRQRCLRYVKMVADYWGARYLREAYDDLDAADAELTELRAFYTEVGVDAAKEHIAHVEALNAELTTLRAENERLRKYAPKPRKRCPNCDGNNVNAPCTCCEEHHMSEASARLTCEDHEELRRGGDEVCGEMMDRIVNDAVEGDKPRDLP